MTSSSDSDVSSMVQSSESVPQLQSLLDCWTTCTADHESQFLQWVDLIGER